MRVRKLAQQNRNPRENAASSARPGGHAGGARAGPETGLRSRSRRLCGAAQGRADDKPPKREARADPPGAHRSGGGRDRPRVSIVRAFFPVREKAKPLRHITARFRGVDGLSGFRGPGRTPPILRRLAKRMAGEAAATMRSWTMTSLKIAASRRQSKPCRARTMRWTPGSRSVALRRGPGLGDISANSAAIATSASRDSARMNFRVKVNTRN